MSPDLSQAVIWYVVFVYSTVCHEAGHAWSAMVLGDRTAYEGGQVSLDPIPHIRREPMGMVAVPIVSYLLGGWMFGWASAPYNPHWARMYPRRAAWMALAGPAANLILLLGAALVIRVGVSSGWLMPSYIYSHSQLVMGNGGQLVDLAATLLSVIFSMNVLLFAFNLLPLPPFDGNSLPLLFLSASAADKYQEMMDNQTVRLIGLIIAFQGFGAIFPTIQNAAIRWLLP